MAPAISLAMLRTQLVTGSVLAKARTCPEALALGWPELDAALPDGGLPRGVIELASLHALGGATSIALAAVRAAQRKSPKAWCAWLDPEGTLYAPGVAMAGVDLTRLLVVRPPREELARFAVKVAGARACDVIVIDMAPVPGADRGPDGPSRKKRKTWPAELVVRKLSLAAEEAGASILLLTDSGTPRAVPWPVALRLELGREPDAIDVRVAKDRRGRTSLAKTKVSLRTRPRAEDPSHDASGVNDDGLA